MKITKRSGLKEQIDLDKIHKVLNWAGVGLSNVSISAIELKAHIQFTEGMTTIDIHKILTKSAADLISASTPNYQHLAARLSMFLLRKRVYGEFTPPTLYNHILKCVDLGVYDEEILEKYTHEEINQMDEWIDHTRDMDYSYAAVQQFEGKYLVQNRSTGVIYESPQMLNMLIGACLFQEYPSDIRMSYVKRMYEAVATKKISLPTPIMAGVRTPNRQYSSCVKIEVGDTLDSIGASTTAIAKYVSKRAGLGINAGRIRAHGSVVGMGEVKHTGSIPFYKLFQAATKSCSQGGVRGGSATVFYPIWHLDVESLLVLKNNKGVEENRVRHLDYGVQFCGLFYRRLANNENITLFCPKEVPGLYEAFFADQSKFERIYREAEANPSYRKKVIPATELFGLFGQERASTGRIYVQNVDHCNTNGPFNPEVAPIRQSNLCLEIALPTSPMNHVNDGSGEIALCTLAAFNLGEINALDDLADLSDLIVRALDNLLTYQNYPVLAAETATLRRRSLGIGVVNYANYLAKNNVKYSDGSANQLTHELFEAIQYHLMYASMNLAIEVGPCDAFEDTVYSDGIMPIDNYQTNVDRLADPLYRYDWDQLRRLIGEYGMRNSTLTALMPSETSSQISNATNGIEPPRGFVTVKASKDGPLKQVVPDIETLRDKYELLWDIPDNRGYISLVGIMQKFVDQAISANTNYDPGKFPDGKVTMTAILQDLVYGYSIGVKTFYYHNTRDGAGKDIGEEVTSADDGCEGGACKI